MARVKFGAMMVDARGKLGGHVFTKNRAGASIRTKVTPTNAGTLAQSEARGRLTFLSQAWSGLSEEQRIAWNSAVSSYQKTNVFGDTYLPSGKNLYVALNSNILLVGGSVRDTPPAFKESTSLLSAGVGLTIDDFNLAVYAASPFTATDRLVVQSSSQRSAGVFNFSGMYSVVGVQAPDTGSAEADVDIKSDFIAKWGIPIAGKKVGFKVYNIDMATGIASAPIKFDYVIPVVTP